MQQTSTGYFDAEDNFEWKRLLYKAKKHRLLVALLRGANIISDQSENRIRLIEEIDKSFQNGELSADDRDDILAYLNSKEL